MAAAGGWVGAETAIPLLEYYTQQKKPLGNGTYGVVYRYVVDKTKVDDFGEFYWPMRVAVKKPRVQR